MSKINPRPGKVEIGFSDDRLTGVGGAVFLANAARRHGLFDRLAEAVSIKVPARGTSDMETQWSLVASLAAGNGALSDVDALRGDWCNVSFWAWGRRRRAGGWGSFWRG